MADRQDDIDAVSRDDPTALAITLAHELGRLAREAGSLAESLAPAGARARLERLAGELGHLAHVVAEREGTPHRRHPRLAVAIVTTVEAGGAAIECLVVNLSIAGAAVSPALDVAVGAPVALNLPDIGRIDAVAVNRTASLTHLAFAKPDQATQARLAGYIQALHDR